MEIKDKNHILYKTQKNKEKYFDDFNLTIEELKKNLSKKKFKNLVNNDLQINKIFEEQKYFQFAVETTINRYFNKKFNYKYEPKASIGTKNMDCGVEYKGLKYNFEVKCPTISSKEENTLYLIYGGEFKDFTKAKNILNKFKNNFSGKIIEGNSKYGRIRVPSDIGGKNSQKNKLLELLKKTEEKSIKGEANILILSLYSKSNFSEWSYNFYEILKDSKKTDKFKNVDGIIITNTLNCHVNYKDNLINPWNWEEHLVFFIPNISKKNKDKNICALIDEIVPYKNSLLLTDKIKQVEKEMFLGIEKEIYKEKSRFLFDILDFKYVQNIEMLVPYTELFVLQKLNRFVKLELNKIISKNINFFLEKNAYEKYVEKKGTYFTVQMMFLATRVINEIEKEKKYFINDENYDTFKQS